MQRLLGMSRDTLHHGPDDLLACACLHDNLLKSITTPISVVSFFGRKSNPGVPFRP